MPTIERVEARTLQVPLPRPTSFSSRVVIDRWYTVVRVRDSEGASGIGFCYAGSSAGSLTSAAVRDLLAPAVVGADTNQTAGLWDRMYRASLLHGRVGSVMRSLSAIDTALWDLNARRASLPLWKYLGAFSTESVPAYASGGYYVDGKGVGGLVDEVRRYMDLGFEAVKIKVGGASIGEDADRIAAVREVLGTDRALMLDANNAWTDLPTALRAMEAWAPSNPYWIEEPFGPDDIDNHAKLAERGPILVATGEIEAGRWRYLELIRSGAAAFLQPDAAVCGGITEFLRIAHIADAFGIPVAPHWFHDLHIHLVAAISNGMWVECFPDDEILNFRSLIDQQLNVLSGGHLGLPTAPGLGFDFEESAIDRFAVDGWV